MEACEKHKTTAVRECREGQRFLLKDLHSRKDGLPSKDFMFNGQANDSISIKEGRQICDV